MKIEQREQIVKNYSTVYIADDGTTFSSQGECEKYERTAAAVIDGRFCKAFDYNMDGGKDILADCLYHFTCCDDDYWFSVTPKNQEEIDIFNMFCKAHGAGCDPIDSSYIGKKLIFCGYDGEYYFVGDEAKFRKQIEWNIQRILTNTMPQCSGCKYYDGSKEDAHHKCTLDPGKYTCGVSCYQYEEREVK